MTSPPQFSRTRTGVLARYAIRRRRPKRWHNVLAVVFASFVVLASLFWILSFTFSQVGSNSMAPALIGRPGHRDRILCWKLAYRYRQPRRWEVALFQTPSNSANREVLPGLNSGGETGITVKRIVGLPGEELAIAGGDIWTRPFGTKGDFRRQTKPDSVQRGMWIGVYAEDFSEVGAEDFLYYWREEGEGSVRVDADRSLALTPVGDGVYQLRYRPRTKIGYDAGEIVDLPGIPDRYLLEQTVWFTCRTPQCGTEFDARVDSQKIQGRCPTCRRFSREEAVTYYDYRSGLPETGPYSYSYSDHIQGDQTHVRLQAYNFVADLRVSFALRLRGASSSCRVRLAGAGHEAVAVFSADSVQLLADGRELGRAAWEGKDWDRVEIQRLDGKVRLFVGADRSPLFDLPAWDEARPEADFNGGENAVAIEAVGGEVSLRQLTLDRDVFYYGSSRHGGGGFLRHMDASGETRVGADTFFPMGDNTTVSLDARSWGPVPLAHLRGTALAIWSPKERRGWIAAP